jgi:GrpB-like predicted nucleotidyltransferase (UPF0157 family)
MTPLEIVPYDARWPAQFARERARLAMALGRVAVRIDHNGSTAVPGLAAKPIIDIQVSVAAVKPMDPYLRALERLGYVHVPHADDSFCPYFHRPAAWPHSHHLHVVEAGGVEESRTLAFRDYLRAYPSLADAYARLKRDLAPQFSADDPGARQAYADAKGAFIERVIAAALADGYPRERG